MQHHIQTLVQHIFHKDTLEAVTVKELQQFTESYPFSGVGQLLLAKKLQDTGAPEYPQQAAKTALYFHNPIWPGWLLQEFAASAVEDDWIPATSKQPSKIGLALHTPNAERETLNAEPQHAERPMANAEGLQQASGIHEPAPINQQPETRNPEPQTAPEPDNYLPPWEIAKEAEIQVASLSAEPQAAEEPVIDQHQTIETGATTFVNETPGTPNVEQPITNTKGQQPVFAEASATKAGNEQPETRNTERETAKQPETGSEPELVFESYHTIDYFASQGIKLKLDDLPKDKLAQQLKSFTEWLRSMKRIAPTDETSAPEEIHQLSSIQKIAEHSVEAKEVITEAMAEVWAKQGNTTKAIAIYEKLSLLNPAKNAYFASRISALKAM